MTVLLFARLESMAQSSPPASPAPRLTVAEYAERVEERSFRGCTGGSALEGTGNPGRAARGIRPAPRRTGTQR